MTDKTNPWIGAFDFGADRADTPAEKAFLLDAERIATEVAAMSDEEVADYLVEHGLQDLVEEDRVQAVLATTLEDARRRREEEQVVQPSPAEGPSFAVRRRKPSGDLARKAVNGGAVIEGNFRRDKVP